MKKWVNGVILEMTPEEIEAARESAVPEAPSPEDRIAQLEAALELLLSGVTE